jgi:hypothetical protein
MTGVRCCRGPTLGSDACHPQHACKVTPLRLGDWRRTPVGLLPGDFPRADQSVPLGESPLDHVDGRPKGASTMSRYQRPIGVANVTEANASELGRRAGVGEVFGKRARADTRHRTGRPEDGLQEPSSLLRIVS